LILVVAGLDTAFVTDSTISLKNYLQETLEEGFLDSTSVDSISSVVMDPPAADVRFDTKRTNIIGNYFVIVKKNTQTIQWHGVGLPQAYDGRKTHTGNGKASARQKPLS
jgi:hypothetical protein